MKVTWVSTWNRVCGIADYSKELIPPLKKFLSERGDSCEVVALDKNSIQEIVKELKSQSPDIVHFQHEYGLFGGKNPPLYTFPVLIDELRKVLPQTKFVATAHTVIPEHYRFPLKGKGWQIPFRGLANTFLLNFLRKQWGEKTWGKLNGTIIHSELQSPNVVNAGSPFTKVVPHFVPAREKIKTQRNGSSRKILVFGFFTHEKGQDIVIHALSQLKDLGDFELILAGGVRRKEDQKFYDYCKRLIYNLDIVKKVTITGYLKADEVQNYLEKADLVIAPFRETSGSGSLAQVLARGLPLLASDLPLNQEINRREPGAIELFKAGDPLDLALKINEIIFDDEKLHHLSLGAMRYANTFSPSRVALEHLHIYDQLLKGESYNEKN